MKSQSILNFPLSVIPLIVLEPTTPFSQLKISSAENKNEIYYVSTAD